VPAEVPSDRLIRLALPAPHAVPVVSVKLHHTTLDDEAAEEAPPAEEEAPPAESEPTAEEEPAPVRPRASACSAESVHFACGRLV
jgi:hypothetical protein